jgi:hypothetical protein
MLRATNLRLKYRSMFPKPRVLRELDEWNRISKKKRVFAVRIDVSLDCVPLEAVC